MAKFDTRSGKEQALALSATLSGTTPAKGGLIDMQGFGGVTFYVSTGTVTDAGTASGFAFEVQESDTTADADFTAVSDADLIGTEAALTVTDDASDNVSIGSIGYRGDKRYVRIVATGTTGTAAVVSVNAVKGYAGVMAGATVQTPIAAT